jgi:hypothetical protein
MAPDKSICPGPFFPAKGFKGFDFIDWLALQLYLLPDEEKA